MVCLDFPFFFQSYSENLGVFCQIRVFDRFLTFTAVSSTHFDSMQELKERIRQRTNLPLGPSIDTHGETFLSQEVVVNLLQETRHAFERCNKV